MSSATMCVCAGTAVLRSDASVRLESGALDWNAAENWESDTVPAAGDIIDLSALPDGGQISLRAENVTYRPGGFLFGGGTAGTERGIGIWRGFAPQPPTGEDFIWNVDAGTVKVATYENFAFANTAPVVIRKTGGGTLDFAGPRRFHIDGINAPLTLDVAEGRVHLADGAALWASAVRLRPGATFAYTSNIGRFIDELILENRTWPLDGAMLLLGANSGGYLDAGVEGPGRVTAIGGQTLFVTNTPRADIVYGAREGDLVFGRPSDDIVGLWTFENDLQPGRDAGPRGNHLSASNGVTVVVDPERGRVASFSGSNAALYATGPDGSLPGLPTRREDFTYAVWIKPDTHGYYAGPALAFWGELPVKTKEMLIYRLAGQTNFQIFAGFDGNTTAISSEICLSAGTWAHLALVWKSAEKKLTIYKDGAVLAERTVSDEIVGPQNLNFSIGRPWSGWANWFKGRMDDAVLLNRAVAPEEIASKLMTTDGGLAAFTEKVALSAGAVLESRMNGFIRLAGEQTAATLTGDGARGGVAMADGGKLTVTGRSDGGVSTYDGTFKGAADFVKDGSDTTLRLTGVFDHTGATEVKAGRLVLAGPSRVQPFLRLDFEDADDLGRDTGGGGHPLANRGAARVWDAARKSWVARFTAADKTGVGGTHKDILMLTGNTDYTIAAWVKPSAACPADASFLSVGARDSKDRHQIQFRFHGSTSKLVLAHWSLDFTGIALPSSPVGAWHHVAAVKRGTRFAVYYDGQEIWSATNAAKLDFQEETAVHVGSYFMSTDANHAARYFDGDIDDAAVYAEGLDAADIRRLMHGAEPLGAALPAPIAHYDFEDAADPGADVSGNGHALVKAGGGTLGQADSPLGGKALAFDPSGLAYLKGARPAYLSEGARPYTVSYWFRVGDTDTISGAMSPTHVSWGDDGTGDNKAIDFMAAAYYHYPWRLRVYQKRVDGAYDLNSELTLLGLDRGNADNRWHHVAVKYHPDVGVVTFVDGVRNDAASRFGSDDKATSAVTGKAGASFFIGAKPSNLGIANHGQIDEVRVYDSALNQTQIRLVMRADRKGAAARVLPEAGTLTVAAGAEAAVETDQTLAAVAGAGRLEVAEGATLTLTGASVFAGTLTGAGTVALDGGAVELADGGAADVAAWEICRAGPAAVTLPSGTAVVADGAAFTLGAARCLADAAGAVTVAGGGTVTLAAGTPAAGTWTLARGAAVTDAGTGALAERWTVVTPLPTGTRAAFAVRDGAFTVRLYPAGTVMTVR